MHKEDKKCNSTKLVVFLVHILGMGSLSCNTTPHKRSIYAIATVFCTMSLVLLLLFLISIFFWVGRCGGHKLSDDHLTRGIKVLATDLAYFTRQIHLQPTTGQLNFSFVQEVQQILCTINN